MTVATACSASGQSYFQVEFLQDFGTIPLLVPDYANLGPLSQMVVSIFQSGTVILLYYLKLLHFIISIDVYINKHK